MERPGAWPCEEDKRRYILRWLAGGMRGRVASPGRRGAAGAEPVNTELRLQMLMDALNSGKKSVILMAKKR